MPHATNMQQTLILTHTDFLITVCRIQRMQMQTLENKALGLVRERIQRLSIRGALECNCDCCDGCVEQQQLALNGEPSPAQQQQQQQHQLTKSKVTRTSSCTEQLLQHAMPHNNTPPNRSPSGTEPIYAVVDLKHKYAQRQMRYAGKKADTLLKRCNSYDSILQPYAATTATTTTSTTTGAGGMTNGTTAAECSHKTSRSEKSLSYTEDDIDGIYEDGELFYQPLKCAAAAATGACAAAQPLEAALGEAMATAAAAHGDEENIYEPINVPHGAGDAGGADVHGEANAFWKYFTRLKVHSLLQLTRRMRQKSGSPDYDTIKFPAPSSAGASGSATISSCSSRCSSSDDVKTVPHTAATNNNNNSNNNNNKSSSATNATSNGTSHFSTIKRKFGTHRKSMQVRMRRLCTRAYEPKPLFKRHHQPPHHQLHHQHQNGDYAAANGGNGLKYVDNAKASKLKYRWKSVKIRARNLHLPAAFADGASLKGASGAATATTAPTATVAAGVRRKSLFGSLPHMRRVRLSLFGGGGAAAAHTPNLYNQSAQAKRATPVATLTDSDHEL